MNNVKDEYILYFKPDTLITSMLVGEVTKKGEQTYLKEQLKKKELFLWLVSSFLFRFVHLALWSVSNVKLLRTNNLTSYRLAHHFLL